MPFCKSCGSSVEGQFCAKCGTPVGAAGAPEPTRPAGSEAPVAASPQPAAPAGAAGLTDNLAGLLCYILGFITGILFLVLEPYNRNKFIRFHAFQSIFFNVAMFAIFIGLSIVGIVMHFIPMMWALMALVHTVVSLAMFVVWVLLLVKAYQGQRWKLPIIGDLAEKQA
jgi:uncharacterized membrane protein